MASLRDSSSLAPGKVISLRRGVRRIVAGNAGLMTGPGTNTYLLGERDIAVVDPGPDDPTHLETILAAAGAPIRWVVTTHTHRDHSPLSATLARRSGAQVIGLPPPNDGRQDESFVPHRQPADAECLILGDLELVAIHTPGHASNCVCYFLERERLLITGDHVLEGVSPVILPPDGNMADYLNSIDKLFAYDFEYIAPGHGDLMDQGKQVLGALRLHRLAREAKVLLSLSKLPAADLGLLTPVVYDDVPADRHPWARLTLEAHLIKLARDGKVCELDGVWRLPSPEA
jgi:glyoxylase-like metal-dependent hydrolase (beta-lactamase superfamily II)